MRQWLMRPWLQHSAVVLWAAWVGLAHAEPPTPWTPELTRYYSTQCQHGLRQQGDGPTKARTICSCMAAGLSKEFGMEEFDNMRTARLDPKGSFHDQRFYRVADECYKMYLHPSKRLQ